MKQLAFGLTAVLLASTAAVAQQAPVGPPVNTLQEMGTALWSCWTPPPDTQNFQVTIRFSLKRSGEVLGKPMITYSTFNGTDEEQRIIMDRILASLDACTPVNLTPALGGAVAGRMLIMTFTSPSTKA
ncbi:hypothetical protein [Microvirga subterranea]|uniref:TonB-like protein n=1 Tax=Microvirga subterranea TaxID=186651 RepID=A0A370HN56_9HYPH|nr:hypothetical protein [Microvirga subterranea]RDI60006.1 hypothetical protein DES45_103265 [Microvirga subterranea]